MFKEFRDNLIQHFDANMREQPLYVVDVTPEELWETYISNLKGDTLHKTRNTHDCSCCRHFIRDVGGLITMDTTLWNFQPGPPFYRDATKALNELVRRRPIVNRFVHSKKLSANVGVLQNRNEALERFDHFHLELPKNVLHARPEEVRGAERTNVQLFERGLRTISLSAIDEVLDLIASNSLYRGEEHKAKLVEFHSLLTACAGDPDNRFLWNNLNNPAALIRNTVIGTLLVDLSEGVDLEIAVKAFESKVAPSNYQRPKSLVTPRMVEQAKAKVEELGLLTAIERRYAALTDVSVNNVLFADRSARKVMKDADPFDSLPTKKSPKIFDRVDEISIDRFLTEVLPLAASIEVLFENKHRGQLVSLVTGEGQLFKWDNPFSWSYNGDTADSDIRRSVQERGGSVTGVFRFTHQWNYDARNASLMDLHVFMPGHNGVRGQRHSNYGNNERVGWNHRKHPKSGGVQDVDYVAAAPAGYVPVENITFPEHSKMPDGVYKCAVQNWNFRSPTIGGFRAEIEVNGEIFEYEYPQPVKGNQWIEVAEVTKRGTEFTVKHILQPGHASITEWGLTTGEFHRVNALLLSPNHWEGEKGLGNKHYFFMLDGCVNGDNARGFYNEFLRSDLTPHRKVLEILGNKQRTAETPNQLSGLGFSSTKPSSVVVRVTGSVSRTLRVTF